MHIAQKQHAEVARSGALDSVFNPLNGNNTIRLRYTSYAVISHSGAVRAGHYVSRLRESSQSSWYTVDDDRVSRIGFGELVETADVVFVAPQPESEVYLSALRKLRVQVASCSQATGLHQLEGSYLTGRTCHVTAFPSSLTTSPRTSTDGETVF